MNRDQIVVRTSIIGIVTNIILVIFKMAVGVITNSIAIILDAVNNLSDAGSSIITIVGTKLATKKPDKKHPFGYGRIEYLTSLLISFIILYAGITSLIQSVDKIIHVEEVDYDAVSILIIVVAIIVKFLLGTYVKKTGEKINSLALVNSGEDAKLDSIISITTLIAALVYIFFKLKIEAHLGVLISLVIIKSGIEMVTVTLSKILGETADKDIIKNVKQTIGEFEEVRGAYDLILSNYGPDKYIGSVHIAVDDTISVDELDSLARNITDVVAEKHNIFISAVGIYSLNTKNEKVKNILNEIKNIAMANEDVKSVHGFYLNDEKKEIRFDLVVKFEAKDREKVFSDTIEKIKDKFKDYSVIAAMDSDF